LIVLDALQRERERESEIDKARSARPSGDTILGKIVRRAIQLVLFHENCSTRVKTDTLNVNV